MSDIKEENERAVAAALIAARLIEPAMEALLVFASLAKQYDARVYPLDTDSQRISVTLGDCRKAAFALDAIASRLLRQAIRCEEAQIAPVWHACPSCGGEGRLYSGHPNDPHPRDGGVCPTCDGDGQIEADSESVECDDLDASVPP